MSSPSLPELPISRSVPACPGAIGRGRREWPRDAGRPGRRTRAGWLLGSIAALVRRTTKRRRALPGRGAARGRSQRRAMPAAEGRVPAGARRSRATLPPPMRPPPAPPISPPSMRSATFWSTPANTQRALEIYDRAVAAAPKRCDAARQARRGPPVSRQLRAGGSRLLRPSWSISPASPNALKGLAELRRQSSDTIPSRPWKPRWRPRRPDRRTVAILHFGLAKSYEDLGEYAGQLAAPERRRRELRAPQV